MQPFLKFRLYMLVLLGGMLSGFSATAQKAWTLKACVEYALQNNLTIKQQGLSTRISAESVFQHRMAMLPTVNGSASSSYNWGRSVDPYSNQFSNEEIRSTNFSLSGNLVLFDGFQLQNSLRQSKLDYLASQQDLQKIQNDISLNIVSAYLQALYTKEQVVVATNRVEVSQKQLDRARIMTEAGTTTRGDLLDAESQLATEEYNKVNAVSQYNSALLSLTQMLELDSVGDFQLVVPEVDVVKADILLQGSDKIYQAALQHLPEIKSAELKEQSAEKSWRYAQGNYAPKLSLFGSYGTTYSSTAQQLKSSVYQGFQPTGAVTQSGEQVLSPVTLNTFENTPFSDQVNNNLTKSLGLSLSVPLFNGWSTRSNVSRAKINYLISGITAEQSRKTLYKSIQQAYNDALAAQQKYAAAEKSVQALQESYSYTSRRYENGLSNSLELLTSTNNLAKARTEFLQAKYDYIFKVKILDFYAGNQLAL